MEERRDVFQYLGTTFVSNRLQIIRNVDGFAGFKVVPREAVAGHLDSDGAAVLPTQKVLCRHYQACLG